MDIVLEVQMKKEGAEQEDQTFEQTRDELKAKFMAILSPLLEEGWIINLQSRIVR